MNVVDYLLHGKPGDKVALVTGEADYTYGQIQAAANAIGNWLGAHGGSKGDRVLLLADNGYFWAAAYLGIIQAGLVCVPLSPTISITELDYILATTGARFAFAEQRYINRNHAIRTLRVVVDDLAVSSAGELETLARVQERYSASQPTPPEVRSSELAALMFTSGSTGVPKGVMVSHGNIKANTESIVRYLELTASDRIMTVLPFHYCFGTSLLHTHLAAGGSLVIDRRFMYPEAVLQRMIETECTGFAGVPSHFQVLLRKSRLPLMNFPHLRYVQQAGGHLAPTFLRELRSALPTTKIFVMYGQTEATARLSYLPPELLSKKMGSVGRAIPGVSLEVLNERGEPVMAGEVGEIVASGENVALGYWKDPAESAAVFRDGRLYTGDLATVDGDGFIYIVDRAKEFLKCGGIRVSCRKIEETLLEFEPIVEVAVVGIPDETLGEAVKAFVVSRSPDVEDELRRFCRTHLLPEMVPKEFAFVDLLPKNEGGKVVKSWLREAARTSSDQGGVLHNTRDLKR